MQHPRSTAGQATWRHSFPRFFDRESERFRSFFFPSPLPRAGLLRPRPRLSPREDRDDCDVEVPEADDVDLGVLLFPLLRLEPEDADGLL